MSPAARRATGLVLIGIVLAVTCTFLGRWQWNRHVWRTGAIDVVRTNWAADPVPLDTVLDDTEATLTDADVWRRVTVVGHYETDGTVLLRNRPVDGAAAYHVLVPFVVDDASAGTAGSPTQTGSVLVVDRGWVEPGADASAEVTPPAPPAGTVTLTARLRLDEPASGRTAPDRQVQAISVEEVLEAGGQDDGAPTYDAYVAMTQESPSASPVPGTLPAPSTDPGSHLSYAFQWWTFALGGLVAFCLGARRELQDERAADAEQVPAPAPAVQTTAAGVELWPTRDTPRPPRPRRATTAPDVPHRRGGRDEDLEDALIDAQLSQGTDRLER